MLDHKTPSMQRNNFFFSSLSTHIKQDPDDIAWVVSVSATEIYTQALPQDFFMLFNSEFLNTH